MPKDTGGKIFKMAGSPGMRGLLNIWIISLLSKKPMNGYEMLKEIEGITEWKPTTGSLYPALHKLKKKGVIAAEKRGERRQVVYSLTQKGEQTVSDMRNHILRHIENPKFFRMFESLVWGDEPECLRIEVENMRLAMIGLRKNVKKKDAESVAKRLRKISGMIRGIN